MANETDRHRGLNKKSYNNLFYFIFLFMMLCREGSSFLAMSSSKDSLSVFEDRWGKAPAGINSFIDWMSFVAVAYTYAFSGLKLLRSRLAEDEPPSSPSLVINKLAWYQAALILFGIMGNGWATAFGTYGSTLANLTGTHANSTMPAAGNTTDLYDPNLTPTQPSAISSAGSWQTLAIILAIGAAGYSIFYNSLQIREGLEGKYTKLEKGWNKPTIFYGFIIGISLLTWAITTYYGAVLAENQAGFNLSSTLGQLSINGILQVGSVTVNNVYAQLPSTEDKFAKKYQIPKSPAPQRTSTKALQIQLYAMLSWLRACKGRGILYGLSDILVYSSNVLQSFGNIGQAYVTAQKMGLSKDDAFTVAMTLGLAIAAVNSIVYWSFRTIPAKKGARELIGLGLDKLCPRVQVMDMPSSETAGPTLHSQSARNLVASPGDYTTVHAITDQPGAAGTGLALPGTLDFGRQRSAVSTARTGGVDVEMSTARPRFHSASLPHYLALATGSSSEDRGEPSQKYYAPNQVPEGRQ